MNWIQHITDAVSRLFKWWFIVEPWEQSIRVRLGKTIQKFGAGVHFQVPFLDRVYIQNTRKRFSVTNPQTVSTKDGKTICMCGSLRYKLDDILKLYQHLHQPEDSICQEVEATVTEFITDNNLSNCTVESIRQYVHEHTDLPVYGLSEFEYFVTDFAVVKTYRLINGDLNKYMNNHDMLNTTKTMQNKDNK